MRLAGMFLLLGGWLVALSAIVLLAAPLTRWVFVLSGIGVEVIGLVLAFRGETL